MAMLNKKRVYIIYIYINDLGISGYNAMVRLNGGSTVESFPPQLFRKAQATQGSRHTGDVLCGRKGSHEAIRLERKKQRINISHNRLLWITKYICIYMGYIMFYIYMYICKIILTNMDHYWIADSIFTQLLVFHKQLTAHLLICCSSTYLLVWKLDTAKFNGVSSSSSPS